MFANRVVWAHIALVVVNIIYAFNYSIAKEVMNGYLHPNALILVRVFFAAIIFWGISFFITEKQKPSIKDLKLLFLCGLSGVVINQILFFTGLHLTSPINASILMITTPLLVLLISFFVIKERITFLKVLGIGFGMMGAGSLIIFGSKTSVISSSLGDLFIFLNALSYGLYLVLAKPLLMRYDSITVAKWVFTFGFIPILFYCYSSFDFEEFLALPLKIHAGITYVIAFTTVLAYLMNLYALKTLMPGVVSAYIYLQPIFAGFIAIFWGTDTLGSLQLISGLVVFVGVYLSGRKSLNLSLD